MEYENIMKFLEKNQNLTDIMMVLRAKDGYEIQCGMKIDPKLFVSRGGMEPSMQNYTKKILVDLDRKAKDYNMRLLPEAEIMEMLVKDHPWNQQDLISETMRIRNINVKED